jgi:hypothetical protein
MNGHAVLIGLGWIDVVHESLLLSVHVHKRGHDAEPTSHEVAQLLVHFDADVCVELTCPAPSLTRPGLLILLFERNQLLILVSKEAA